jgi:DNA replication protein DnaC
VIATQLRITICCALNRGPDEWLATFADPVRAQSAIDRFTSNAYDLVIEGESYRPRLKPRLPKEAKDRAR